MSYDYIGPEFYMGASVGYSYFNNKISEHIYAPGHSLISGSATITGISQHIAVDAYTGYRYFTHNNKIFGLELIVGSDNNLTSSRFQITKIHNAHTVMKSTYKLIPTLFYGQRMTKKSLIFIKLGMGIRKFNINHKTFYKSTVEQQEIYRVDTTCAVAAVGMEYTLHGHTATFAEISFERLKTTKLNYKPFLTPHDQNGSHINSYYTVLKIGILYRF